MAGIMKTLWDLSAELENEMLRTHSVLSDDYTSRDDNLDKLKEIEEVLKENEEKMGEKMISANKKEK